MNPASTWIDKLIRIFITTFVNTYNLKTVILTLEMFPILCRNHTAASVCVYGL